MNRGDRAAKIFMDGLACSQAVLVSFSEELGIDVKTAMKVSSGFAAGMRIGEVCGAVTGALMVIGLASEDNGLDTSDKRARVNRMTKDFHQKFKDKNKSVVCREILKYDLGIQADMDKAEEEKLFVTVCPKMVRDAVEILESMDIFTDMPETR
jgi:C_GCAxxG_C_C family probable redox protein